MVSSTGSGDCARTAATSRADNILAAGDGRICVVDFENQGPADPSHELAMVLDEFVDDEADRVRSLVTGYRAMGWTAEVSRRRHFTMLVAEPVTHL